MKDDTISRKAAIDFKVSHGINECGVLYVPYGEVKKYLEQLPSAQQNRIARETAGKSPDEIYDFLYWLMLDYGMRFTDSRAAVIEWLKQEENR